MSEKAKTKKRKQQDDIHSISKNAILRLCRRAGVKRISRLIHEEMLGNIKVFLEQLLGYVLVSIEASGRKSAFGKDVVLALHQMKNYSEHDVILGPDSKMKACAKKPAKHHKEGATKSHKFHPGTVALQEIKHYQKISDCLAFRKAGFSRLVRGIAYDMNDKEVKFKKGVIDMIQAITEENMVKLLEYANIVAINGKRETIQTKDIQVSRVIMGQRS